MIEIGFAGASVPASGALAVLVRGVEKGAEPKQGPVLQGVAAAADAACGGALTRAMAAAEFTGKAGSSCVVLAPGAGLRRVVLVGVGAEHGLREMEAAGGAAVAALLRDEEAALAVDGMPASHAAHAGLGAMLRSYRFGLYRTKEPADQAPRLKRLVVLADDVAAAGAAWPAAKAVAHGSALARDMITEPPNVLTPAVMAERCLALRELGVEVEVLEPAQLREWGALMGVSQGSANEPRVVVMQWKGGAAAEKPVCFVGKGVTFDTGGISIKPAAGMGDMKYDMAGAGAVIGAMAALAGRRARANVVGLVGLTENMPSGTAMRPGDVVSSLSGQTIEVLNTDAEGRLVLADVIWYAQDRFQPTCTIDLATLTGAIIVSLGHEHAGLFCNDEALAGQVLAAGKATGEGVWRMPLGEAYDKLIRSDIADMKNIGGRPGGAIIGAQFIQRFVRGPWAHLDIAGMAWATKDTATVPKGGDRVWGAAAGPVRGGRV